MRIPGKVSARACNAPVKIALVVEDGASTRATAHEVHGAKVLVLAAGRWPAAGGREEAQIDFGPRILVAADDDAGPVDIDEQNRAVGWALTHNVVFNGQVEVRVAAARHIALQLVGRVCQLFCEGREVAAGGCGAAQSQARVSWNTDLGALKHAPCAQYTEAPRRSHQADIHRCTGGGVAAGEAYQRPRAGVAVRGWPDMRTFGTSLAPRFHDIA